MRAAAGGLVLLLALSTPLRGQDRPTLSFHDADGRNRTEVLGMERGYATIPFALLAELGWELRDAPGRATAEGPEGARLSFTAGTPYFRWNDTLFQFTDPVFEERGNLRLPLQLLTDFLPTRFPDRYVFDGPTLTLRAPGSASGGPEATVPPSAGDARSTPERPASDPPPAAGTPAVDEPPPAEQPLAPELSFDDGPPMVILDAGHGGADPGSIGRGGVREKTVALGIALAARDVLRRAGGIEVRMIRSDDTFVPLWSRGAEATRMRGNRAAIFVSVHANSFNSPARGFETYFLSEARTEHERRVAEIENAPLGRDETGPAPDGDLDFILRELRNLDHQHWSGLLAEFVQEEVDGVHPGPNRGVKQGPFAVITNALMPSVLVEIGYLSHPEEARLLGDPSFQRSAGEAIARAVGRFFERYPPRAGGGAGGRR